MPVRVSLSEDGRFDGPEDGHLWGLAKEQQVLVRPPQTTMRFEDFLQLLLLSQQGKRKVVDPVIKETFYLEYLSVTQYLGESMTKMIPLPKIFHPHSPSLSSSSSSSPSSPSLDHTLTNLWMGKGNTTSPLHYDDYENFLCQIRGRKELVLFPPNDLHALSYIGRRKGLLSYQYPNQFSRTSLHPANYSVVFGSSIRISDTYEEVLEDYPEIERTTPYRVTLEEGQTLFIPAYWHHEVTSFPDGEGINLAVNFWFHNTTVFTAEEKLFSSF